MYELQAPSLMTLAGESLTPFEFPPLLASTPSLALQARGPGEQVLVLPRLCISPDVVKILARKLANT